MKKILNYFKQRRDEKLKLKCLDLASHTASGLEIDCAKEYYDWVTSSQSQ